jgi:hypothetical protein
MPSLKQGKAHGDGVHGEQFSDLKVFFVALALCQCLRFILAANNLDAALPISAKIGPI